MSHFVRLLSIAILLSLGACDNLTGPVDPAPAPLTELPRALTATEQAVISGSNQFAFELLREVAARDTSTNIFLSPLSASMALGMTMNGARGETFDGMRAALGFGSLSADEINASYRSLIDLLRGLDRGVEMRIANSIWTRQGFPVHAAFLQSSRTYFDAEARELPFDAAAVAAINDWVKRSTNGKIESIVNEIPDDLVMYLINAIYFKGSWTTRFDRGETRVRPFHREDGTQTTVLMMQKHDVEMLAGWDDDVRIADLPYGSQAFAMTVVLPREGRSVAEVVAGLDQARWDRWIGSLQPRRQGLHLPRFRMEYEVRLNGPLIAIGMETAFTPYVADFFGISPRGRLYIDEVKQKTFVDVNEQGTEAAAVTAVGMMPVSAPPAFVVDRPFLVAIRERLSGTILFLGVIGEPKGE